MPFNGVIYSETKSIMVPTEIIKEKKKGEVNFSFCLINKKIEIIGIVNNISNIGNQSIS